MERNVRDDDDDDDDDDEIQFTRDLTWYFQCRACDSH
jgi:hypothetical protein